MVINGFSGIMQKYAPPEGTVMVPDAVASGKTKDFLTWHGICAMFIVGWLQRRKNKI